MAPTISVIIPTWCEAEQIVDAVLNALRVGDEVIVADANSPDGTAILAQQAGARVVRAPKGRGPQLDIGARASGGDVLLFLHADARLGPGAAKAIGDALAAPDIGGGNFFLRFEPETPAARLFTWANDARRRYLRIYYGDSAVFLRRETYFALGGFRSLPLFEDYELIRRLERAGPTAYIRHVAVHASARRFEHAPLRTLAMWGILQSMYSAGVDPRTLARFYRDARGGSTRWEVDT